MADKKEKFRDWLESVENAFLAGDLEQSETLLGTPAESIAQTKDQRLAYDFLKIRHYWHGGDLITALKNLQKFLRHPDLKIGSDLWIDAMILHAHISYSNAQISSSEKILKKIINTIDKSSPLWQDVHFNLASIARDQGLISEALKLLQDVIVFPGSSPELLSRAALAIAKIKSDLGLEGTVDYTRIVIEKAPKWGGWNSLKTAEVLKALSDFREGSFGSAIKESIDICTRLMNQILPSLLSARASLCLKH